MATILNINNALAQDKTEGLERELSNTADMFYHIRSPQRRYNEWHFVYC